MFGESVALSMNGTRLAVAHNHNHADNTTATMQAESWVARRVDYLSRGLSPFTTLIQNKTTTHWVRVGSGSCVDGTGLVPPSRSKMCVSAKVCRDHCVHDDNCQAYAHQEGTDTGNVSVGDGYCALFGQQPRPGTAVAATKHRQDWHDGHVESPRSIVISAAKLSPSPPSTSSWHYSSGNGGGLATQASGVSSDSACFLKRSPLHAAPQQTTRSATDMSYSHAAAAQNSSKQLALAMDDAAYKLVEPGSPKCPAGFVPAAQCECQAAAEEAIQQWDASWQAWHVDPACPFIGLPADFRLGNAGRCPRLIFACLVVATLSPYWRARPHKS